MRTTLILPEALIDEARKTLGFTSKTDTVVHALREVVRRGRREDLMGMIGHIGFEADPTALRKKNASACDVAQSEMIVADTSVWVEADRRPLGQVPNALRGLIDADELALALPVRLELTSGVRKKDRKAFLHRLSGLPLMVPTEDTWKIMERWIPVAADKGHRFAITDLLIAALADEAGALVWSLDDDFHRMEQCGIVRLYSA